MSKIDVNTPKYWRLPVQNGDDQQEVKKVENTPRKPELADWEKEINRLFNKFGKENVKKVKDKIISFDPGERPIPALTTLWDFDQIANKICELHSKKNADYGDAAYESYKDFGLISYVIRLGDKFRRLKTLTSPGYEQQIKTESIEDTLMDLAAYSIMAIEALHKK